MVIFHSYVSLPEGIKLYRLYLRWRSSLGIKVLEGRNPSNFIVFLGFRNNQGQFLVHGHIHFVWGTLAGKPHKTTMEWKRTIQQNHALLFVALHPGIALGFSTKELSVEKIFCVGRSQAACIQVTYPSYKWFRSLFANHILWWHKIHTIHHYWPPLLA